MDYSVPSSPSLPLTLQQPSRPPPLPPLLLLLLLQQPLLLVMLRLLLRQPLQPREQRVLQGKGLSLSLMPPPTLPLALGVLSLLSMPLRQQSFLEQLLLALVCFRLRRLWRPWLTLRSPQPTLLPLPSLLLPPLLLQQPQRAPAWAWVWVQWGAGLQLTLPQPRKKEGLELISRHRCCLESQPRPPRSKASRGI